jgi:hypothetical protein
MEKSEKVEKEGGKWIKTKKQKYENQRKGKRRERKHQSHHTSSPSLKIPQQIHNKLMFCFRIR